MGKRTAAASVIDRNNVVAEYTRPEIAFDSLFGHRVTKPLPIVVMEDEDGSKHSLCPDRTFIGTNVLVAIDGPYHWTERQQAKIRRQDLALNGKGYRVLHIDTPLLMVKKHHEYVRQMVENFLALQTPSKRLAA